MCASGGAEDAAFGPRVRCPTTLWFMGPFPEAPRASRHARRAAPRPTGELSPPADWRRQPTVCAHAFNSSSGDAVTGCDFPLAQISLRLFSARLVAASSVHAGFHEEFRAVLKHDAKGNHAVMSFPK